MKPLVSLLVVLVACGSDDDSLDGSLDAMFDTQADVASTDVGDAAEDVSGRDAIAIDAAPGLGSVTFVPIYEGGSTWNDSAAARAMVDRVFADFAAHLRTSGDWDATIEIYLTDDNVENANTTVDGMRDVVFAGQSVRVVPAWAAIVQNVTNGAAQPDGTGAEFTVHFNVGSHADNDGLLRHEMMHGMGAINRLPNFVRSESGDATGPEPGDRIEAALYDLQLVDLDRNALLGNYRADDGTFEVQPYRIEGSLAEWMDGDGGVFFRGLDPEGPRDMSCGTFPFGPDRGGIVLNEPSELMVASLHPTWDTIEEPDRAFFRAMGYNLTP